MTLLGVQRRFTEIGRIRTGEKVTKGGKSYPSKLDTFRLTSGSIDAMKAVAEHYGGSVEKWEDEYQVITTSASLDVMVPPFGGSVAPYSLNYELWSGGGCQRRCNGEEAVVAQGDQLVESACLCDPDRRDCKPTLRVSFFLPDILGFGLWRLSSTGYNAAAELPGMLDLLAQLSTANRPIRAVLRLEQRTAKRAGKTHNFAVPVIDLPYSMAELTAGQLPVLPGNGHGPLLTSSPADAPATGTEAPSIPEARPRSVAAVSEPPADEPVSDQLPLDEPLTGDTLERWRAGTHAAMRARVPAGVDEHAALRELADTVLRGIGDRSLNDLTYREWMHLARALRDMVVIQQAAGPDAPAAVGVPSGEVDSPAPDAPIQQVAPELLPPAQVSPDSADPDPAVEHEVWKAALAHGLVSQGQTPEVGWAAIDDIASSVFGKDAGVITNAEWSEFAVRTVAGEFDATPARPR